MKWLNSTNSVLIFFLILLFITLCSVFLFVPNKSTQDVENVEIAKIELKNFSMYQINGSFVEMKIEGEKGLEFSDHEVIYEFLVSRYGVGNTKKGFDYMSGSEAIKRGNNFEFPNGAIYSKSDGESFWSESGHYDYTRGIFNGKGNFTLSSPMGEFKGKDIVYNQKSRNIQAKDIISQIYLEGKNKKNILNKKIQEEYRKEK